MTRVAVLVVAVLMAGMLLVHVAPAAAMGKTHDMKGTVVSVNVEGKSITFKDDSGASITAPVLDAAAGLTRVEAENALAYAKPVDNPNAPASRLSRSCSRIALISSGVAVRNRSSR